MHIFVRKLTDGHYLKSFDVWTSRRTEAFDFESSDQALSFISGCQLTDVEVVLALQDHRPDELQRSYPRVTALWNVAGAEEFLRSIRPVSATIRTTAHLAD
jgi:hypothetical protein